MPDIDRFRKNLLSSQLVSVIQTAFLFLANIITKVILARLLSPKDFGLFALAILFFSGIDALRDLGIASNLIRSKEEKYYGNAILLYIINSILLIAVINIAGKFFTRFDPALPAVIKVYVVLTLINSFAQIASTYLRKNLLIAKTLLTQFFSSLVYIISTIVFAVKGLGALSFVLGQMLSTACMAILLWIIFVKAVNIEFTLKYSKTLLSSSKYFLGLSFVGILLPQVDSGILGLVISTEQIGYYFMALSLVALPYKYVTPIFYNYIFPLFSKIQDDKEKLYRHYRLNTIIAMGFITPICALLFFKADTLILWLYGKQWAPAVFITKALAFWPLITPHVLFGDDVINIEKEKFTFYSYIFYLAMFCLGGYFLTLKMGIAGCIIAKYISEFIASLPRLFILHRIFQNKILFFKEYLVIYYIPFLIFLIPTKGVLTSLLLLIIIYLAYFVILKKEIISVVSTVKETLSSTNSIREFL